MQKIINLIEKYIVPLSLKMSNQRHFAAVRDGFSGMSGLIMISSISTLLIASLNGVIDAYIIKLCRVICYGSFSFMGLFACFGIANELWKSYNKDNLQGAFIAVAIFISISNIGTNNDIFSAKYLLTAIFVAIISVEALIKVDKINIIKIKFHSKIPPAVGKTLDSIITPMLVIFIFISLSYILNTSTKEVYISNIITTYIQSPLENIMNSVFGAVIVPLNNSIFWTLGIHGSQAINLITNPIMTVLSSENMMLAQQGAIDGYNIVTSAFFMAFVWHGGSGSTLGLLIAIIICGKKYRLEYEDMIRNSLWPGIFNINETVIFSAPIVLNPILGIPFIIVPIINSLIAYFTISLGLVSPCIVQSIPWITPPIISGFLATGSVSGAILSGITLVISTIIYIPFVIMSKNTIK